MHDLTHLNIITHIFHTILYTFPWVLTENLFKDHKPLKMVITSPILMFDSGVIP